MLLGFRTYAWDFTIAIALISIIFITITITVIINTHIAIGITIPATITVNLTPEQRDLSQSLRQKFVIPGFGQLALDSMLCIDNYHPR